MSTTTTHTHDRLQAGDRWLEEAGQDLAAYLWSKLQHVLQSTSSFYLGRDKRAPLDVVAEKERICQLLIHERSLLNRPGDAQQPLMDSELLWIVYTVALAILNPVEIPWDATELSQRVKNRVEFPAGEDLDLKTFFSPICVGNLVSPSTIIDAWGRILAWHLPDVLSKGRIEDVNISTVEMAPLLSDSYRKGKAKADKAQTVNWRIHPDSFRMTPDDRFTAGSVDLSAGWFAQAKERLEDPIVASTCLREPESLAFLKSIRRCSLLFNAILALTHRPLYDSGHKAMLNLKKPSNSERLNIETHPHVHAWNSVYTGMSIITNRVTRLHRDRGGDYGWYDLLFSAGTHEDACLEFRDIQASLSYNPGTVVMCCGKLLSHAQSSWDKGERICISNYMRNRVLHRLEVYHPGWSTQGTYTRLMNKTFVMRHGWGKK